MKNLLRTLVNDLVSDIENDNSSLKNIWKENRARIEDIYYALYGFNLDTVTRKDYSNDEINEMIKSLEKINFLDFCNKKNIQY